MKVENRKGRDRGVTVEVNIFKSVEFYLSTFLFNVFLFKLEEIGDRIIEKNKHNLIKNNLLSGRK